MCLARRTFPPIEVSLREKVDGKLIMEEVNAENI